MLPQMSFNYRGFYETWRMLDKATNLTAVNVYTLPWIVNGAFACELGLKYILTQNEISYKKEHYLHKLFELLPDEDQVPILNELHEKCPDYSNEQLTQEILLASDAFCNFRYSYEHALTSNLSFLKVWYEAIFNQVASYPSYELTERTNEPDITMDEFDEKMLRTQNEMLSKLKK